MSPSEERLNPWLLPRSWQWATVEEIADTTSGGTPRRDRPQFYGGTIPWVKSGELRDGVVHQAEEAITEEALAASSAKLFPKGTVCIALYGATVGRLGILGIDASTNQAVCGIFHTNAVLPWFLFRFLQLIRQQLVELGKGGAQPNISQSIVRQTRVPVAPSNEQQRILDEIDKQFTRLDAAVAALRRIQANLKRYRAAVLKAACEGSLVPSEAELARREGRSWACFESDSKPPDGLPVGWQLSTVQQSIRIIDYRGRTPPFSESGLPHLRSSNIRNGKIIWEGVAHVTEEMFQKYMTRGLPEPGDILFTTEAPLGEVALAPTERRFSVAQRIMILRPTSRQLDSRFLMYQIMNPRFQSILYGRGTGTTVTGVSSRNFRPAPIAIPPLAEQLRIVEKVEKHFSVIDELESQCEVDLKRAERLRQSVLKHAFEGTLVHQDPNDEPANVLLERIRADRKVADQRVSVPARGRRKKEATRVS